MISVPRWLLLVLAALFSAYHVVLGVYSLTTPASPWPTVAALVLYAFVTVLSLWPVRRARMPDWLASLNLAVAIVLPLLVSSQLDPTADNGYATWYVAAVGTLMTITAARRQLLAAWVGVIALAVQTLLWAGPLALGALGVVGSIVWVGIAHMLSSALAGAARSTRRYVQAEREAAAWQAAQDAHLFEGSMRLAQTQRIAAPMLRRIADAGHELSEAERRECRTLEAAIRDEIRGRMLLTEAVRRSVKEARDRGATVTLLDEGGIDDLDEDARDRVLSRLAEAISGSRADRVIARTAAAGSPVAVTVVGLRGGGEGEVLESDDAEVELAGDPPRGVSACGIRLRIASGPARPARTWKRGVGPYRPPSKPESRRQPECRPDSPPESAGGTQPSAVRLLRSAYPQCYGSERAAEVSISGDTAGPRSAQRRLPPAGADLDRGTQGVPGVRPRAPRRRRGSGPLLAHGRHDDRRHRGRLLGGHVAGQEPQVDGLGAVRLAGCGGHGASYSGMLPCFLGGRLARFVRSARSALVTETRVAAGSMTPSSSPRSAARNGEATL